ncbi:hypothetical protein L6R52_16940 [Myxococcota bacterium]|nr:hypothetical protein [Myxococcota bacterium]
MTLALLASPLTARAQTTTSSTSAACVGEKRCAAKLARTLDKLARCQDRLLDEPAPAASLQPTNAPLQVQLEYRVPTWVWVVVGVSVVVSAGLGIYTVVNTNEAIDRVGR